MTSHPRLPSLIKFTIGFLVEKLAKLSISNINMSSSSRLATSYNEVKLKDNICMKFFYGKRARLRAYLIQVKLVYSLNLEKYFTKANKVIITVIYLREDAQF